MYSSTRYTRSYSITSDNDESHVINGRCPNYALTWNSRENYLHWKDSHDYFIGNDENIQDGTREIRLILSDRLRKGISTNYLLFCDLDGVLADFNQGIINKFNKSISDIKPSELWSGINKSADFFETLPWMPKGKELWSQIRHYNPIILTGVPPGNSTSAEQKKRWCQRELGEDIKVITCLTLDKPKYCLPRSILIDDRTTNLNSWKDKGGKFIIYNENNLDEIVSRVNCHMLRGLPSP